MCTPCDFTFLSERREHIVGYNVYQVKVFPHIPLEVINRLECASKKAKADFTVVEIGGTVGEYQNALFLEAARMMRLTKPGQVLFIMVSYLPIPEKIGEMKTKPTQHAVRAMNAAGIQPDIIIARAAVAIDKPRKERIALNCNISAEDIIAAPDVDSIYDVPINFERDDLGHRILEKFGLNKKATQERRKAWTTMARHAHSASKIVRIGIVGKYFSTGAFTLADSYISVIEAVKHASWAENRKPEITWLDAEAYEKNPRATEELKRYDGIILPVGFGSRWAVS